MSPPRAVAKSVAPFLALLGEKIRQRGFTELEVEEALSWDRAHLQQLMVGLKNLHVDEMHQILGVIGVEPKEFFADLYGRTPRNEWPQSELTELSALADSLANLLVKNGVVTASEMARAVAASAGTSGADVTSKRQRTER